MALDFTFTPEQDEFRAFVIAETLAQAKDAAEAITLDIDELPSVTDAKAAAIIMCFMSMSNLLAKKIIAPVTPASEQGSCQFPISELT